ncbi:MAG TPA: RDD family protein [Thermomonas sp.]|nr:RDD family protein [Xanthomonadaceae bacterium]HQQ57596.1 RDD family protein [Thermomonas sp.]
MTQWHYADRNHQQCGPVDDAELVRLFRNGDIRLDSLVWHSGLPQWQALSDFSEALGLQAAAPASPYMPPTSEVVGENPIVQGGEVVYAGFWKRVAAYTIDSIVVGMVGGIIGGVIGGVLGVMLLGAGGTSANTSGMLIIQGLANLAGIALGVAYFGWMHSSSAMATLGKMAIGIKVVREDGTRISFLRGMGRYFALIVSSIPLGLGFVMAGFTERKRALHDMMCDTVVVDKWAFTAHPQLQRRELGTVTVIVLVLFGLLLVVGILAAFAAMAMITRNLH